MSGGSGGAPGIDGEPGALRAAVERARAEAAAAHHAGGGGVAVARQLAAAFDGILGGLFAAARDRGGRTATPLSLVAIGGYGRRELCPGSDLDLVLLGEAPEAEVRPVAEGLLHPLWDCRVEVGCAVRGVAESVGLAAQDLTACTALLDARLLAGDEAQFDALRAEARRALFGADVAPFVQRLRDEKQARHARFGDTVYLLEPNLKSGHGGLRDLLLALWAAKARWRVGGLRDLLQRGVVTERQVNTLRAARDFLLRVRTAAHLFKGRREDRLLFEVQEAIAPALFPAEVPAAAGGDQGRARLSPAVEALLRTFYLHAKAVVRESERLLERAGEVPARRPPHVVPVDASFVLFEGQLSVASAAVLRERPGEMVRLFREALALSRPVYGHTCDLIAELAARPDERARLAVDPEAGRELLALLCDPRDAGAPSALERVNDLGLLAAVLPEWGPVVCRAQHDLYHVFTVDQHSLYAVGRLKALARGELAREHPTATAALREVRRPAALYLGTLLHDIGKPLGKGHSEKGARLCRAIAARLCLAEEDARRAEWLVRYHLLMSHLSQRRDLHDEAMIASFAARVGDEETLRELYLLTFADLSMVAPGNLTEWKEMLLRELYQRTLAYLRRGAHQAAVERGAPAQRRLRRAAALLGEASSSLEVEAFAASLPERYFSQFPPRQIAAHLRLARARGDRPLAVELRPRLRQGFTELILCARDEPGTLARVTGVLLAHRIDVLGAQVASRPLPEGRGGEALDVFYVRDRRSRERAGDERWARVVADLSRVIAGQATVEELLRARPPRSALPPRLRPPVATEIEVDNQVSEDFTVIDVYTLDRLGVLHAICATLELLGLDVGFSKVATEAHRVADVFYVRDREHLTKITDEERLQEIARGLTAALERVPEA